MRLETDINEWKFLPAGENGISQFVSTVNGQRNKFTENPDVPELELAEFIKGKESFSVLIMPPCSLKTVSLAQSVFKHVVIVDYNEDRLSCLCKEDVETLLVKNSEDFRAKLFRYSDYLSYGKVLSYLPVRYRRLDRRLSALLDEDLMQFQKEQCSFAVNRSLKRWHRNLNVLKNIQNSKNLLRNLPNIKGRDALIVGAGPSLDSTVAKLKKFQHHYYIICTDGALKTLIKNGVLPDFIVSCEDSLLSWQFFRQHINILKNTVLMAPYNANHYMLNRFKGKLCLTKAYENEEWIEELFKELPLVEPGRCVGHYAFNLAIAINAGRIIMTGFDLAFKGSFFHPKDMPVPYFHEMDLPVPVTVKSVDGQILKTDLSMLTYLQDFEYMIANCKLEVIDATEGGAYIKGTEVQSLDNILFKNKKTALDVKMHPVNYEERLKTQCEKSVLFNQELKSSFTSFLVQNADFIDAEQKLEDLQASKTLCDLLLNKAVKKESNPVLLIDSGQDAKEIFQLFDLPEMNVVNNDSLSGLIQKMRELKVKHVYCVNSNIPPDLAAVENLKCTDLRMDSKLTGQERNLWIDGYSCLCLEENFDYWREILPEDIPVSCIRKKLFIEKVG